MLGRSWATLDGRDMIQYATTFSELVGFSATNDPHGTILGWWRRVDRAVDDFYAAQSKRRPGRIADVERDLVASPDLGEEGMMLFRQLRLERNRVAHRNVGSLTRQDAVVFAQQAHRLGWAIGAGIKLSDLQALPVDDSAV